MIHARDEGLPFVITGTDWPTRDGTGIRDYIHVWDLATAHVAALTRFDSLPGPATAINLGTGSSTTVRELLGMFNRVPDRPVRGGPRCVTTSGPSTPTDARSSERRGLARN
jgi:UDP-glucose 4-epimerase